MVSQKQKKVNVFEIEIAACAVQIEMGAMRQDKLIGFMGMWLAFVDQLKRLFADQSTTAPMDSVLFLSHALTETC